MMESKKISNEELLKQYGGIVGRVVTSTVNTSAYYGDYFYFDDLRQEGFLEMFKLYKKWLNKNNSKFSTYLFRSLRYSLKSKLMELKKGIEHSDYELDKYYKKKVEDPDWIKNRNDKKNLLYKKKMKENPEYSAKVKEYQRLYREKLKNDPEYKEKMKLKRKQLMQNPEYRKKNAERSRLHHEKMKNNPEYIKKKRKSDSDYRKRKKNKELSIVV